MKYEKQTVFLTAIVLSAAMTACAPQADAPGTLPASTDAGTFVAVSYTHLDVYKRQPLGPASAPGCDEPTSRCQTPPSM